VKYKRIRSLARGIDVLRYLNLVQGAYPVDIGKALGLPRPTAHRLLEALEELDLVYRGPNSREFRLTPSIRLLAGGGNKFERLRTAAWPAMRALTAEVIWPCGLAVLQETAMLVIESTCRRSSMSSGLGMAGQSYPLLSSALGKTFLSHCSQERRNAILSDLRAHAAQKDLAVNQRDDVESMAAAGYHDGCSMSLDYSQSRWASIAVPVRAGGEVIASMNLIWPIGELTFDEACKKLKGPLILARDRIEAQLSLSIHGGAVPRISETLLDEPGSAHARHLTFFNIFTQHRIAAAGL
jgi:IclR family mhp operon transcriptional activator